MSNPRTRRIGEAENAFVISPETANQKLRTLGEMQVAQAMTGVGIFGNDYSANIEDRRNDPPIMGPHPKAGVLPKDYLKAKPPAGLEPPDQDEMQDRLDHERAGPLATRTTDEYVEFSKQRRNSRRSQ